jgi:hypothetical protein
VTPIGLGLSLADIGRLVGARSEFGRSEAVVCPHFDHETQGCGIWQTRNAVCSTWFCKHERGAVTLRFWQAVRDLLGAVEERLSGRQVMDGLPPDQVMAILDHRAVIRSMLTRANAGEELPQAGFDDESPGWYDRMWGEWAGREEEWFLRTAEAVGAMDEDDLLEATDGLEPLTDAVVHFFGDLSVHELPEALRFSPGAGSDVADGELRLVGYSPFDPIVLPEGALADLARLDGRRIAQVREDLEAGGTDLDDRLLGLLYDFGIVVRSDA